MIDRSHDGVRDQRPVARVVALREIDGQAFVEPMRRGVVGVVDGRSEDEMGELVRDHDPDPGVVDRVGADIGEQRPDVGKRDTPDILARRGPEDARRTTWCRGR